MIVSAWKTEQEPLARRRGNWLGLNKVELHCHTFSRNFLLHGGHWSLCCWWHQHGKLRVVRVAVCSGVSPRTGRREFELGKENASLPFPG